MKRSYDILLIALGVFHGSGAFAQESCENVADQKKIVENYIEDAYIGDSKGSFEVYTDRDENRAFNVRLYVGSTSCVGKLKVDESCVVSSGVTSILSGDPADEGWRRFQGFECWDSTVEED